MRILDVSAITDSKQFFPKHGTLQFLQDAYKEQLNNLCLALLGSIAYSPTTAYVLFGCVNSGSGSNYVISAGAIFYNGEVFSVPAVSLTASGNVPVANIVTAYYMVNADPVTYSDGTTDKIHNIRTITIGLGTSGSGVSDYSAFVNVNLVQPSQVLLKGGTAAFTPTLATDPANKEYVDSAIGVKCVFVGTLTSPASSTPAITPSYNPLGLTVTAARSTSGNYTITHGLSTTNYFVMANGLKELGTTSAPYSASYVSLDAFLALTFQAYTGTGSTPRTDESFTFQIFTHP